MNQIHHIQVPLYHLATDIETFLFGLDPDKNEKLYGLFNELQEKNL